MWLILFCCFIDFYCELLKPYFSLPCDEVTFLSRGLAFSRSRERSEPKPHELVHATRRMVGWKPCFTDHSGTFMIGILIASPHYLFVSSTPSKGSSRSTHLWRSSS
jgi:hypothetical protein